jgi:hypothetical protein
MTALLAFCLLFGLIASSRFLPKLQLAPATPILVPANAVPDVADDRPGRKLLSRCECARQGTRDRWSGGSTASIFDPYRERRRLSPGSPNGVRLQPATN